MLEILFAVLLFLGGVAVGVLATWYFIRWTLKKQAEKAIAQMRTFSPGGNAPVDPLAMLQGFVEQLQQGEK